MQMQRRATALLFVVPVVSLPLICQCGHRSCEPCVRHGRAWTTRSTASSGLSRTAHATSDDDDDDADEELMEVRAATARIMHLTATLLVLSRQSDTARDPWLNSSCTAVGNMRNAAII
jgi:hypothetical protein